MLNLNNLIPCISLFLKESKLIFFFIYKLILRLNLLIHLMFKLIQMCNLFHINFMLLSKLFINRCLAIFYNNKLSHNLIFAFLQFILKLLTILLFRVFKVYLINSFAVFNQTLFLLLRLL